MAGGPTVWGTTLATFGRAKGEERRRIFSNRTKPEIVLGATFSRRAAWARPSCKSQQGSSENVSPPNTDGEGWMRERALGDTREIRLSLFQMLERAAFTARHRQMEGTTQRRAT
uniref:Uncharacterized protein n=1 Tax=Trichuris muris TaxID=70415 RepID=A0A5S6QVS6_TRIMR